ncbi:hypothetical protein J5N97_004693 [Dioscorea zingiberensis]|uniref:Uncharacterized protein n=1 Tax=Dioscorea zingiberensis TaxID=325984 RepID=A0A9D5D8X5_9LILI|nr:hypothetical protein J5N97_004693 [Dioscorea zingiberensis]
MSALRHLGSPIPWRREMILENLDSLWFFSNILLPSTSSFPIPCNHGNTRKLETDFTDNPNPPEQTPTSTSAQLLDPHTVDILNTLKAAESGTDLEAQVQTSKPEIEEHPEMPKNSRATRKQKKHQKKTVDVEVVEEFVFLGLSLHQLSEKQRMRTRRSLYCCSMPPLSDGLAMKEHLKSWAYAVACTVR